MANPKKREQEQAFLILVEDTKAVADDIINRETLAGFKLSDPLIRGIEDTYFDTPDNDLRMSTVTLRKRVVDGETLITFKGKEKKDAEGKKIATQDHQEWEFAWPETDLQFETLAGLAGLNPVQRRTTKRITRYLFGVDEAESLFELNLDNSLYTVSTGQARLVELEVERQGNIKLKPLVKAMQIELPYLTPWDHGKFATGKAVEFAFGVKTDNELALTPESFNFIEHMFKQLKPNNK